MEGAERIVIFARNKNNIFIFAATVAASFGFSSCTNPPVNPDDDTNKNPNDSTLTNDSTDTEEPGDGTTNMSAQWTELNKTIQEDFNTTVTIPEPDGEYQFTVTKGSAFGSWVSGRYELTFNPQMIDAVLNYPQVLKKAGWKKVINGNEEQGYSTYYSDTEDYLIMPYIDEATHQFAILYIYNRSDVGTISNWEEI